MRSLMPMTLSASLVLAASPVAAHTGHLGTLAGHDHWVIGLGLGAIAGAAVVGWLKGGKREEEAPAEDAAETAPEEAPT